MSKYIDLAEWVIPKAAPSSSELRVGVKMALNWLDRRPDQVPGRTVTLTESQVEAIGRDAINYFTPGGTWADWARAVFVSADFQIVPDPKPSNEERLAGVLRRLANFPGWEVKLMAGELDKAGVKAPEADDE